MRAISAKSPSSSIAKRRSETDPGDGGLERLDAEDGERRVALADHASHGRSERIGIAFSTHDEHPGAVGRRRLREQEVHRDGRSFGQSLKPLVGDDADDRPGSAVGADLRADWIAVAEEPRGRRLVDKTDRRCRRRVLIREEPSPDERQSDCVGNTRA